MAQTMLFGPLGNLLEVPYPQTGMDWSHGVDAEETQLVSGGRHVYRAPTPYRSYHVEYKAGTPGLRNLIDIYSGVYGPGPFYLHDFNWTGGNLLPTRWASGHMLAAVAGNWCLPQTVASTLSLSGLAATFTNTGMFPASGPTQTVLALDGVPLHLRMWGSATGGAVIKTERFAAGAWTDVADFTPSASPSALQLSDGTADAVRLRLHVPSGGTLTVAHANLTESATGTAKLPGLGIGAVSCTSVLSGTINTKAFDRIGLSLDLVETEQ